MHPNGASANDHHIRGRDPRDTAEQDPAAAQRLLEEERPRLGRDLARHLAHRGEQRQAALAVLHRLVGHADRAALLQAPRQVGGGREVQVGEQGVLRAQQLDLRGLRLLDPQDHVRLLEDGGGVRRDPRPLGLVGLVRDRAAVPGVGLDQHLVAVLHELAGAHRRQRDAVLVLLDLGGDPDPHENAASSASPPGAALRWTSLIGLPCSRAPRASRSARSRNRSGCRAPRARRTSHPGRCSSPAAGRRAC